MSFARQDRRKTLVVDGPVQARFVRRIAFWPALLSAALGCFILWLGLRCMAQAEQLEVEIPSLTPLLMTTFVGLAMSGLLVCWQALRYSHAIVGPLHRVVESMRRVRAGDLDVELRQRAGDELQEFTTEFNHLVSWIRDGHAATAAHEASHSEQADAPQHEPQTEGAS